MPSSLQKSQNLTEWSQNLPQSKVQLADARFNEGVTDKKRYLLHC